MVAPRAGVCVGDGRLPVRATVPPGDQWTSEGDPMGSVYSEGVRMTDFHALQMTSITGDVVDFDRFRDTVCLVVNVASA